jgi:peroxiredoxin
MTRCILALAFILGGATLWAGEYNMVLNIGDAAPAFRDLPATDGKKYSLDNFNDKKLLLVVFTGNSCPVAVEYEDRMIAFAKRHADHVGVVAINVGRAEEDNIEAMKERDAEKKFPYPYLADPSQKAGRDYGAGATPEFILLSPERKVVYMGAMDDNSDAAMVKKQYLEDAVQAALAGKEPAVKETYPHGCRIRYARQRRPN